MQSEPQPTSLADDSEFIRDGLRFFLVGLFLALIARAVIGAGTDGFGVGLSRWMRADWLISYDGGFVQRGLSGSVLRFLHVTFGINANKAITGLAYVMFLGVVGLFARQIVGVMRRIDLFSMMVLLFLPALSFFPLLDQAALGRKETLFIFLLVVHLYVLEKTLPVSANAYRPPDAHEVRSYLLKAGLALNALGILLALTHESLLLLGIPINALIMMRVLSLDTKRGIVWRVAQTGAVLSPMIIACIAAFAWRGDQAAIVAICESWASVGIENCAEHGPQAIGALNWSLAQHIALPHRIVTSQGALSVYLVSIAANFAILLFVTGRVLPRLMGESPVVSLRELKARFTTRYLLLPALFSVPLYATAWDWGRWVWAVAMSYVFVLTFAPMVLIETRFVSGLEKKERVRIQMTFRKPSEVLEESGMSAEWRQLRRRRTSISLPWWSRPSGWIMGIMDGSGVAAYGVAVYVILFVRVRHCCLPTSQELWTGLWHLFTQGL